LVGRKRCARYHKAGNGDQGSSDITYDFVTVVAYPGFIEKRTTWIEDIDVVAGFSKTQIAKLRLDFLEIGCLENRRASRGCLIRRARHF
jgi:hypothetical protein